MGDATCPPTPPGMRPVTPEILALARGAIAAGVRMQWFAHQHNVTLFALYAALGRP